MIKAEVDSRNYNNPIMIEAKGSPEDILTDLSLLIDGVCNQMAYNSEYEDVNTKKAFANKLKELLMDVMEKDTNYDSFVQADALTKEEDELDL